MEGEVLRYCKKHCVESENMIPSVFLRSLFLDLWRSCCVSCFILFMVGLRSTVLYKGM